MGVTTEEIRYVYTSEGLDELEAGNLAVQESFGGVAVAAQESGEAMEADLSKGAQAATVAVTSLAGGKGLRGLSSALSVVNPQLGKGARLLSAMGRAGPVAGAAIAGVAVAAGGLYLIQQHLEGQLEAATQRMEEQARVAERLGNATIAFDKVTQQSADEYAVYSGQITTGRQELERYTAAVNAAADAQIKALPGDDIRRQYAATQGILSEAAAAIARKKAVVEGREADEAAAKAAREKAKAEAEAARATAQRAAIEQQSAAQAVQRQALVSGLLDQAVDANSDLHTETEALTLAYTRQEQAIEATRKQLVALGADEFDLMAVTEASAAARERYTRDLVASVATASAEAETALTPLGESIDAFLAQRRQQIFGSVAATGGAVTSILTDVGEIIGREGGKNARKQHALNKAAGIGNATMATAQGVTMALGASPPPFNFIQAGAVGAAGAIQIAKIASTPPPQAHDGAAQLGRRGPDRPDERTTTVRTLRNEIGVGVLSEAAVNTLNGGRVPGASNPTRLRAQVGRTHLDREAERSITSGTSRWARQNRRRSLSRRRGSASG